MYNYDEIYDRIISNTESVDLPADESIKIVNKIYKDLEMGLLKPRNITKKTKKLICNSLTRQNNQKENLTFESYQVETFISKIKPKLEISDIHLKELEDKLLALDEITEKSMNETLIGYLDEIGNESLKMIKNQSFRDLNDAIIGIDNPLLANKYGLYGERILLYGFIDHDEGLLFELLREGKEENPILTKREVENEVIRFLDKEETLNDEYDDIRSLKLIDNLRDEINPDVITVKFIEDNKSEYLKVKLESVIGSKLIGVLCQQPKKMSGVSKGSEVVISYFYDYADNLHVYVDGNTNELVITLKRLSQDFKNPSKDLIVEKLSALKNTEEFDTIVDTFHSTIFDYFRDLNDFYTEIKKGVGECI